MMIIKKISLLTLIIFSSFYSGREQENDQCIADNVLIQDLTPQELLRSKEWNIQGMSVNTYIEYSDTEEILYIGDSRTSQKTYYISDTNCFEQPFASSEIGQINSGRFLVNEEGCYYLTIIDQSTVQMSHLSNERPSTINLIARE